ncbi:MAG TPA: PRC-barrel domain-containing protein, partial [Verrucomicrobiae bacterium]|nr:PRC-barrel domain-containing protein [Verrucomicrobiae bacterium]
MKPNLLITALIALSMQGLYAGNQTSTSAQEQQGSTPGPQTSTEQAGSQQAPREVKYSKLKDANIVSKSGENLGKLDDVLFNPRTGKIQFAILGSGGLFGLGEKRVPVPWQAINVTSEKE